MGNNNKHTPGPWLIDLNFIYVLQNSTWMNGPPVQENRFNLSIYGAKNCPKEEIEANIRLIAAAPDMYDLLLLLRDDLHAGHMAYNSETREAAYNNINALLTKIKETPCETKG